MISPPGGWRQPLCDSRTGASHRRRGAPCQDASGIWSFMDPGWGPVQLLVVSDGHGGSRYDRSDIGSRLACSVALQAARELFDSRTGRNASLDDWRRWLAEDLPRRIVARWCQQVLTHAEAHPRGDGAAPSTVPYGATLGLLLLTPRWWGCTGLGDWDLVRLDGDGRAALLSEEPATSGAGEATYSLCMTGAEQIFAGRCALHPIAREDEPFSLLLSTDGIRKSCGTDADFLTLADYLCGLNPARPGEQSPELSAALDHISSQGSGDDVSVAIGHWGPLSESERRLSRRRASQPRIVQPDQPPASTEPAAVAMAAPAAAPVGPAHGLGAPDPPHGSERAVDAAATGGTALNPPSARWSGPLIWLGLAALLLAGAGVATAFWLGLGPWARRPQEPAPQPLNAEQWAVVQREATQLCAMEADGAGQLGATPPGAAVSGAGSEAVQQRAAAGPGQPPAPGDAANGNGSAMPLDPERLGRIRAHLLQRKPIFTALLGRSKTPDDYLRDPQQDPLGSLIAWSARQPGLGPLPPIPVPPRPSPSWPDGLLDWMPSLSGPAEQSVPPPAVSLCPALREALRQHWRALQLQPAQPPGPSGHAASSLHPPQLQQSTLQGSRP